MKEEWKTVLYDGITYDNYEVSNLGRVRSLNYKSTGEMKILKYGTDKNGYLKVNLSKNGRVRTIKVHRLVALLFVPNSDETKTEVNHIDENKENNSATNLEWCNRKENINHGTRTERQAKSKGKSVKCVETGEIFSSMAEAAREKNVTHTNVYKCCHGQQQTTGGYHWEFVEE